MRLWSLHPRYLDAKGLVALWREALLAQKVLRGDTKGYRNHPQLIRFQQHDNPLAAMAAYLREVQHEATRRGYRFDVSKIAECSTAATIRVTEGQMAYERTHLEDKLAVRDVVALARLRLDQTVRPHPLFEVVPGEIAEWEIR